MKKCLNIKGMHCRSCEILVEDELAQLKGVSNIKVSSTKGTVELEVEANVTNATIEKAIKKAGYSLGNAETKNKIVDFSQKNLWDLLTAIVILGVLYLLSVVLGLRLPSLENEQNLGALSTVFLVGLTAGLSTCMALVGGLVLGLSANFGQLYPNATSKQKMRPHLMFNLGRILGFTILGGLIGLIGGALNIAPIFSGILTAGVGLFMLIVGIQTLKIFPIVDKLAITLPKGVFKFLRNGKNADSERYSDLESAVLGALTFFIPCGFTQAVQLYAATTGNFVTAALTMMVFAIGTSVGLLSVGGIGSLFKKDNQYSGIFNKVIGIIITLLGLASLANGVTIFGVNLPDFNISNKPNNIYAENIDNKDVQVINMVQDNDGYKPNSFTIKKGVPVRWVITSLNPYSCASSLTIPKLKISQNLKKGENIIEFTPTETGTLPFSCSMGMYRGQFKVVDGK